VAVTILADRGFGDVKMHLHDFQLVHHPREIEQETPSIRIVWPPWT
jgi:hypothetical protein